MECNIDAQGKAARLIGGIAGLAFGVVMTSLLVLDVLNGLVASSAAAGAIFSNVPLAKASWRCGHLERSSSYQSKQNSCECQTCFCQRVQEA